MADDKSGARAPERLYRHSLATRITHWINAAALFVLLLSGLQILNAHPRLYWGQYGANADSAFISFWAAQSPDGPIGLTNVAGLTIETTGLFGLSYEDGQPQQRAMPAWLTIPSWRDLAEGRRWHFFFAWVLVLNGLAFLAFSFASGHVQRDLALRREELRARHLLAEIWEHVRLRPPRGEAAKRYNTLQKSAYLVVIFGLLPIMVLTGLTMSPGFNAIMPYLLDLFGGRQSARTIHFIAAALLVLFFAIHIFQVFVAGAWNEIRSMVTGWYVVKPEKAK